MAALASPQFQCRVLILQTSRRKAPGGMGGSDQQQLQQRSRVVKPIQIHRRHPAVPFSEPHRRHPEADVGSHTNERACAASTAEPICLGWHSLQIGLFMAIWVNIDVRASAVSVSTERAPTRLLGADDQGNR